MSVYMCVIISQFKKEHIDGSAEALAELKAKEEAALFGVKK